MQSIGGDTASVQSILNNIRQIRAGFDDMDSSVGQFNVDNTDEESFQSTFQNAIKSVSDAQMESKDLKTRFELGDPGVTLEQVTIASQQASIGFEAMLNVRNKLVDAYKEIMNMPV